MIALALGFSQRIRHESHGCPALAQRGPLLSVHNGCVPSDIVIPINRSL